MEVLLIDWRGDKNWQSLLVNLSYEKGYPYIFHEIADLNVHWLPASKTQLLPCCPSLTLNHVVASSLDYRLACFRTDYRDVPIHIFFVKQF